MKALDDPYGAIRHALLHPVGDRDPLPALLHAGMKLTICFDDISLPLPLMEAPDIRQMVIETVLDMAADAGVDDVMLIAALALHRRMTEDELRHALGDRIYDAFAPHGLLTQHDAEDPDNLIHLGQTESGEEIEINKRAGTSDLLIYVNINLVAMDGWAQERGHRTGQLPVAASSSPQSPDHAALPLLHGRTGIRTAPFELAHGAVHRREPWREDLPDRDHAQHRHLPVVLRLPAKSAQMGVELARPRAHLCRHLGVAQGVCATSAGPWDLPLH